MEKLAGGKSFEDLDKAKEMYERFVKNFNRKRKNAFKDLELAWNGLCPGCCQCMGQKPTLKPKHPIGSLDVTSDAMSIGVFSKGVVAQTERIKAIQTAEEEKKKIGKGNGK